ncbi:MAG: GGDEF domain-containing protein [Actinobacteria bacterium]|nr:GGDEF domain-containing protein [Actinomycetota bacterium]
MRDQGDAGTDMSETISNRFVGRLIGFLYFVTAVMAVVMAVLPVELSFSRSALAVISGPVFAAAAVGWFAPWDRWPRWTSLTLAIFACVVITGGAVLLDINPSIGFPFYVLVCVWVGLGHSAHTASALLPFMGLSLFATHVLGSGLDSSQVTVGVSVVVIGVVVGETLARIMANVDREQRREASRLRELEVVIDAIEDMASQVSPDGVGSHVAWFSGELMGGLGSLVLLLDLELEVTGCYAWGLPAVNGEKTRKVAPEIWQSIRDGEVVVTSPADAGYWVDVDGARSVLWAPVRGVEQGGLAFERVRSKLSLLDQSLRDELTGVGNRRHAMALLAGLSPGDGVMMIDLDHFKQVNDSFGHETGDALLRELGGYLSASLRDRDAVARFGGDEFVALLRGVGDKVDEVVVRLLDGWRALNPATSLSIGLALHEAGVSPHVTLQRADEALYEAKGRGREQGVVFPGRGVSLRLAESA